MYVALDLVRLWVGCKHSPDTKLSIHKHRMLASIMARGLALKIFFNYSNFQFRFFFD